MQYPKISIVTPCFNAVNLIDETLDSVLGQGYPNLEYIVIDGGSSDGTAEIIQKHYSKLAFFTSEKDLGQYDAINKGFKKATGDILAWLNADDLLLPKSLFTVADIFMQLPQVDWISSLQPASWDANGRLAKIDRLPGFSREAFLDGLYLPTVTKKGYWLQQESTFWRKRLWEKVGNKISPRQLAGDFSLWCEFYKHAELYGVDYPLGGFRTIEGQRSEDINQYMQEANTDLQSLREYFKWNVNLKNWLRFNPLNSLPAIANFNKNNFGYYGYRITNANTKIKSSPWQLNEYRFLP